LKYYDSVKIPSHVSVRDVTTVADYLRGIGFVDSPIGFDAIGFGFEANDAWDAAMTAAEIQQELAAYGFDFSGNKYCLKED
jgi:hypothetical protein